MNSYYREDRFATQKVLNFVRSLNMEKFKTFAGIPEDSTQKLYMQQNNVLLKQESDDLCTELENKRNNSMKKFIGVLALMTAIAMNLGWILIQSFPNVGWDLGLSTIGFFIIAGIAGILISCYYDDLENSLNIIDKNILSSTNYNSGASMNFLVNTP